MAFSHPQAGSACFSLLFPRPIAMLGVLGVLATNPALFFLLPCVSFRCLLARRVRPPSYGPRTQSGVSTPCDATRAPPGRRPHMSEEDDDESPHGEQGELTTRRHRHNESERVRMRTIAVKIAEMKAMMGSTGVVVPKEKAKILTGAVEYMKHLTKVAMQKSVQLARLQEALALAQQQQGGVIGVGGGGGGGGAAAASPEQHGMQMLPAAAHQHAASAAAIAAAGMPGGFTNPQQQFQGLGPAGHAVDMLGDSRKRMKVSTPPAGATSAHVSAFNGGPVVPPGYAVLHPQVVPRPYPHSLAGQVPVYVPAMPGRVVLPPPRPPPPPPPTSLLGAMPFVMPGKCATWPAFQRWANPDYLATRFDAMRGQELLNISCSTTASATATAGGPPPSSPPAAAALAAAGAGVVAAGATADGIGIADTGGAVPGAPPGLPAGGAAAVVGTAAVGAAVGGGGSASASAAAAAAAAGICEPPTGFYSGRSFEQDYVQVPTQHFFDYYRRSKLGLHPPHYLANTGQQYYLCQCPILPLPPSPVGGGVRAQDAYRAPPRQQQQQQQQQPLQHLSELFADVEVPLEISPVTTGRLLEAVSAWITVERSQSGLHYDCNDNLLCVVVGRKTATLFPPTAASAVVRPAPIFTDSSNHSVLPPSVDFSAGAGLGGGITFLLNAGDALFIPEGWWHSVTSERHTIAVNFWWGGVRPVVEEPLKLPYVLRTAMASAIRSQRELMVASRLQGLTPVAATAAQRAVELRRMLEMCNAAGFAELMLRLPLDAMVAELPELILRHGEQWARLACSLAPLDVECLTLQWEQQEAHQSAQPQQQQQQQQQQPQQQDAYSYFYAGHRGNSVPPLLPRDRRLMGGVGYAAPQPAPLRVLRASENVEFSPTDVEAAAAARENLKRFMPLPKSVTAYRSYGEVGEVLAPPFGSASLPRDSLHQVKLFDPMTGPKM